MELCFQAVFNVWRRLGRRTADSRPPQTAASRGILIDYGGGEGVRAESPHPSLSYHIIFHPVCILSYRRFIPSSSFDSSFSFLPFFSLSLLKRRISHSCPCKFFSSRYIIKACKPDDILHGAVEISPLSNLLYSRIFFSLDES